MHFHRALPRILFCLATATLAFSAATGARAEEAVVELDPTKTRVEFTLGDVLHTVRGTFRLKAGTVRYDPATGKAGGLVVVDATSGDSGSHARDHKMHKEILESAQYPEITFRPEKIQGTVSPQGDSQVQVQGTFNLHGAGHPLTLTMQAHVAGGEITADTHFPVPYASWGLKNPSTFILRVSDTVEISIHMTGHIKPAAAPQCDLAAPPVVPHFPSLQESRRVQFHRISYRPSTNLVARDGSASGRKSCPHHRGYRCGRVGALRSRPCDTRLLGGPLPLR